jgi:peptidoglycan/LPS O-acetylase OafA/YrhL
VLAALLVGVLALFVRYRRADETGRRQLLWLLLAGMVVLAAITPWSLVAGTPIVVLFSIPLIPLAICIAVSSWTSGSWCPAPWPGWCSRSPPSSPTSRW